MLQGILSCVLLGILLCIPTPIHQPISEEAAGFDNIANLESSANIETLTSLEPSFPLSPAPSSDPFNIELLGEYFDGEAYEIEFWGNYSFLADGHGGIEVFSFDQSLETLTKIGEFDPGLNVWDIAIYDHYLYGFCVEKGLYILDIQDPLNIEIKSTLFTGIDDYISEIFIEDHYAYLGYKSNFLKVMDLTDPINPTVIETFFSNEGVEKIEKEGDILVISQLTNSANITLLNVTDLTDLTHIATLNVDDLIHNSYSVNFDVKDGYLYVIPDRDNRMAIYNITDPDNIPTGTDIGLLFRASHVLIENSYLYVYEYEYGSQNRISIYNLTTPTSLTWIDQIDTPHHIDVHDWKIQDGVLFSLHMAEGMSLYNLTNPNNIVRILTFDEDIYIDHYTIELPYLYMLSDSGLEVYEFLENSTVVKVSELYLQDYYNSIQKYEDVLYLLAFTGMYRLNISDVSAPTVLSHETDLGNTLKLTIENDILALVSNKEGVKTVYVYQLNSTNPMMLKTEYNISDFIDDMVLQTGFLFVLWDTNLTIIDVRNVDNITVYENFPLTTDFMHRLGVHIMDNYLFLMEWPNSVNIYNISDLNNPLLLATVSETFLYYFLVEGDFLFVLQENAGNTQLVVYDIINLSTPEKITSIPLPGSVYSGMMIEGTQLYLIGIYEGISIFNIPDLTTWDRSDPINTDDTSDDTSDDSSDDSSDDTTDDDSSDISSIFVSIPGYSGAILFVCLSGCTGILIRNRKKR